MSKVRVLVGTKKGAFILTADGKRKEWKVNGPHFAGWEMYHLKGSLADPKRILEGEGKVLRYVTLRKSADAERSEVRALVRRAFTLAGSS